MAVLLIAEHDNKGLKDATHKALTAAAQIGGDVHVLVAGNKADGAAAQAAKLAGVKKVLHAESAALERPVAEPMAATIVALAGAYEHIVAPATTNGNSYKPRTIRPRGSRQEASPIQRPIGMSAMSSAHSNRIHRLSSPGAPLF